MCTYFIVYKCSPNYARCILIRSQNNIYLPGGYILLLHSTIINIVLLFGIWRSIRTYARSMGHGHMGRSVEFARGHVNDVPSLVYTVLRSFGGHEKPRDEDCLCVFNISCKCTVLRPFGHQMHSRNNLFDDVLRFTISCLFFCCCK